MRGPANKALKLTRLSTCSLGGPGFGRVPSRGFGIRLRRAARDNHLLPAVQLSAGVRLSYAASLHDEGPRTTNSCQRSYRERLNAEGR